MVRDGILEIDMEYLPEPPQSKAVPISTTAVPDEYQLTIKERDNFIQLTANLLVAKGRVYDLNIQKEALQAQINEAHKAVYTEEKKLEGAHVYLLNRLGMQAGEFEKDYSFVRKKA
jgi:hypothetical protein